MFHLVAPCPCLLLLVQVKGASTYIAAGNDQVQGAIENAKKARKWQCCILICVMIVVGILILVLFVFKKNLPF